MQRTKGSKWTEEQVAYVRARRDAGDTAYDIARDLGGRDDSLRASMRKRGIQFEHRPYMPRKPATEEGERFRQARERAGLSNREAAKALGLSLSTIYNLEAGMKKNIRVATLQRAARVYGVTVKWLIQGGEEDGP